MISGASTRTPNIMRAAPRASARRWRRCATCPRASARRRKRGRGDRAMIDRIARLIGAARRGEARWLAYLFASGLALGTDAGRSEDHTSELQSLMRLPYAVFFLKKTTTLSTQNHITYTLTLLPH